MQIIFVYTILLVHILVIIEVANSYLARFDNKNWGESILDDQCIMFGRNMTGILKSTEDNLIRFDIGDDGDINSTSSERWVSAKVQRRWLMFGGCYYNNFSLSTLSSNDGDTVPECLKFCDFRGFYLSNGTCYCMKKNYVDSFGNGCLPRKPTPNKPNFVGAGRKDSGETCLCIYKPYDNVTGDLGEGNCQTARLEDSNKTTLIMETAKCSDTHIALCKTGDSMKHTEVDRAYNWSRSVAHCFFSNSSQFEYGPSLRNVRQGRTYWTGVFRPIVFHWTHDEDAEHQSCVTATLKSTGQFKLNERNCSNAYPSWCTANFQPTTQAPKFTIFTNLDGNDSHSLPSIKPGIRNSTGGDEVELKTDIFLELGVPIIVVISAICISSFIAMYVSIRRRRKNKTIQTYSSTRSVQDVERLGSVTVSEGTHREEVSNISKPETSKQNLKVQYQKGDDFVELPEDNVYNHLQGTTDYPVPNSETYDIVPVGGAGNEYGVLTTAHSDKSDALPTEYDTMAGIKSTLEGSYESFGPRVNQYNPYEG